MHNTVKVKVERLVVTIDLKKKESSHASAFLKYSLKSVHIFFFLIIFFTNHLTRVLV